MEDIKILELFYRRDEHAISETDSKYGRRCHRISFDIVGDKRDAEECVDDTYLALWNSIPPNCPNCYPAYIYRILRRHSLNRLSSRMAQKRGGGEFELALDELSEMLASKHSPEQELEARELAERINYFLSTLSREQRLIFLGRYWLMLPTEKIACRLGFSDSRVRTSLHRSRKMLHRYLSEEGLI